MDLLFKREQSDGKLGRVSFKLWGKLELSEDEQALLNRYHFDQAILLEADQPELKRSAGFRGVVLAIIGYFVFGMMMPFAFAVIFALIAGGALAYWHFHKNRETIFVRDLLHGRNFSCGTVIDLARKEAWLTNIVSYLRQVMESAKHWDGTERYHITALPKEEARQITLQGV